MLIQSSQNIADTSDDDISHKQLEDVQAYLESRRLGMIPHPRLREAWEHFYGCHKPLICTFVAAFHLSEADRNDCIQEVWKEVVVKLVEFRCDAERGRFRTWLLVLARHKAAHVVRRRVRHPAMPLEAEAPSPTAPATRPPSTSGDDCRA
jgi:RNA polymerase sigma-70 factor (ECF subfamily)